MNIKNDPAIVARIKSYTHTNLCAIMLTDFDNSKIVVDFADPRIASLDLKKLYSAGGYTCTFDEYVAACMLSRPEDSHDWYKFETAVMPKLTRHVKKVDVSEFVNDAYIKKIHFPSGVFSGKYESAYKEISANELFNTSHLQREKYDKWLGIGYFDSDVEYPVLCQNGNNVFEVGIREIRQYQESIKKAHGNVAILGAKLGYLAYMMHLKDEVNEITIVEDDKDIIDFFVANIMPQFDNALKLKIVKSDYVDFLLNIKSGEFDYVFCDFDIAPQSMDAFIKLKLRAKKIATPIDFYNESQYFSVCCDLVKNAVIYDCLKWDMDKNPLVKGYYESFYTQLKPTIDAIDIDSIAKVDEVMTMEYAINLIKSLY